MSVVDDDDDELLAMEIDGALPKRRSPREAAVEIGRRLAGIAHNLDGEPGKRPTAAETREALMGLQLALDVLADRLSEEDTIDKAINALVGDGRTPTQRVGAAVAILRAGQGHRVR